MRKIFSCILISIFLLACRNDSKDAAVIVHGFRNQDTLFVRIDNKSKDSIFIPLDFWPSFRPGSDTIFRETFFKEKYSKSFGYQYSKLLPFTFMSSSLIEGVLPDTVLQFQEQVQFFNQFRISHFKSVPPGESFVDSSVFYVPKNSRIIALVYYSKDFFNQKLIDTGSYQREEYEEFDKAYSKLAYGPIYQYLKVSKD